MAGFDERETMSVSRSRIGDERKILRYCWFCVFLLHIVFLTMGIYWLNEGYKMIDISSFSKGELQFDSLFLAMYLQSIAFSLILLMTAIYVYVIQSRQEALMRQIQEIRQMLLNSGNRGQNE